MELQIPELPHIYHPLLQASRGLIANRVLDETTILQRAIWLADDLPRIQPTGFQLMPTREIEIPHLPRIIFPIVEYQFSNPYFSVNHAEPNGNWTIKEMDGTGLDSLDLLYLSKVVEIARTHIPRIWKTDENLRKALVSGTSHVDALNEIWWLSKWHGIDPGSVEAAFTIVTPKTFKSTPPDIDWRFTVLGGQLEIRLEVKNRKNTKAAQPLKRISTKWFADNPHKKFLPSRIDQINVLAITAYHSGVIPARQESKDCISYLNLHPELDAIAIHAYGPESIHQSLYFPDNRPLEKKDLLLKAIFKPADQEDASRLSILRHPLNLDEAIQRYGRP